MDVIGTLFVKSLAGFAFVACFPFRREMQTIDCLGKNTGTRSLAYASRTTEKISMSQLVILYSILKSSSQTLLSHDTFKCGGSVFSSRYNIIVHLLLLNIFANIRFISLLSLRQVEICLPKSKHSNPLLPGGVRWLNWLENPFRT